MEITRLLIAWTEGDQAAFDEPAPEPAPIIYDELRYLALQRSRERDRKVAQTTEQVTGKLMRRVMAGLACTGASGECGGGMIRELGAVEHPK